MDNKLIIGAVVLLLLSRRGQTTQAAKAQAIAKQDYLNDPTTWGADQWARLYGDDLLPTDAQGGHTAYYLTDDRMPIRASGFNGTVSVSQKGLL